MKNVDIIFEQLSKLIDIYDYDLFRNEEDKLNIIVQDSQICFYLNF